MNANLMSRYAWIVDTLLKYGKLSRAEINRLWLASHITDGKEIPARTFFHYRRGIEETFHIDIKCTPSREYYIEQAATPRERAFTDWMLNSLSTATALGEGADAAAGRVIIEEIPSSREFFPIVLDAIRESRGLVFTHHGFARSRPETGIRFHPWFLRLYKQRWYMVGLREKGNAVRTYALDRIRDVVLTKETFPVPEDLDPEAFFDNIVGITSSKAQPRTVRIRTDSRQAKYLRALPLHSSQTEEVGDGYSIFSYRLKLNYELVHEILAMGPQALVLEPKELRLMVIDELNRTLSLYNPDTPSL